MLVLSRKTDERILVGQDIEITVTEIRGNTVRIGIKAPQQLTIRRGELIVEGGDLQAARKVLPAYSRRLEGIGDRPAAAS